MEIEPVAFDKEKWINDIQERFEEIIQLYMADYKKHLLENYGSDSSIDYEHGFYKIESVLKDSLKLCIDQIEEYQRQNPGRGKLQDHPQTLNWLGEMIE